MSDTRDADEIMTCDAARSLIVDELTHAITPAEKLALNGHLAGCSACRARGEELRALWADLGKLPVPPVRSDASQRFQLAVEGAMATPAADPRHARARYWRRAAVAAGIVIVAAGGYFVGGAFPWRQSVVSKVALSDAGHVYLLLLRVRDQPGAVSEPGAEARLVAEYAAWARRLSEQGKLLSAEKLADEPAELLGSGASQEADRVGGFFLIRATSFEEAQQIARDCPHLRHGGRVELRAIEPT